MSEFTWEFQAMEEHDSICVFKYTRYYVQESAERQQWKQES